MNKAEWDFGVIGQRLRFTARVLRYYFSQVKSLYLFVPVILGTLLMMVLILLPPISGFSLSRVYYKSFPNKNGIREWKYYNQHQRCTVWKDSLFAIDYSENCLNIYENSGKGYKLKRRMHFREAELSGVLNQTGEPRPPMFYVYSQHQGIRRDYAYDYAQGRYYLLSRHDTRLPAYNLDNEGTQQSISPYLVYKNELYYYIVRYGFEESTPSRGIWKLNLDTGARTQLLATGAFPETLTHASTPQGDVIIATFGSTSNGATFGGFDDNHAYVIAYDPDGWKELWRWADKGKQTLTSLFQQPPDGKLFEDRFNISYYHFGDFDPDRYYTTTFDLLSGKVTDSRRGYNIPAQSDAASRYIAAQGSTTMGMPFFILDKSYAAKSAARGWGSVFEQFRTNFPVFHARGRTLLCTEQKGKGKNLLRITDPAANEYLMIDLNRGEQVKSGSNPGIFKRVFQGPGSSFMLSVTKVEPTRLTDSVYQIKPRPAFALLSGVYRYVGFMKQQPVTSILIMLMVILVTGLTAVMTVNRQYRSFRRIATFFSTPDQVLRDRDRTNQLLKARVEHTTVAVIRVIGLNNLIGSLSGIKAQTELVKAVMDCLSRVCFRPNVIIDKYLNEGIMLWVRGEDRESSMRTAVTLAVNAREAMNDLSARLKLPNNLELAIGISHGENLVGLIGSQTRMDLTCVGRYVNLAFRMAYAIQHPGVLTHLEAAQGLELPIKPIHLRIKGFEDIKDFLLVRSSV